VSYGETEAGHLLPRDIEAKTRYRSRGRIRKHKKQLESEVKDGFIELSVRG